MGCVQSYFKRAHNAGLSPSSTQESTSKQAASEDGRVASGAQEERSITEEPESNDTSHGVEATAVRTLAATTGTVAILGTTAKTDKKESEGSEKDGVETIPEEKEEAVAVVHEEKVQNNSVPNENEEKARESVTSEETLTPTVPATEVKEETPSESLVADKVSKTPPGSNKSVINVPNEKSPPFPSEEAESKNSEESSSDLVVSELAKEKEDDVSKSISSERLKTNSISNTTLSSDSIAEFESNSVKQSPSVDKVIESFDSSSTVEFVDVTKDVSKVGNAITNNPARSISSDLSNKVSLPVDGEKTPEVTSPVRSDENTITAAEPLPAPSSEQVVDTASTVRDTPTKVEKNVVLNETSPTSPTAVKEENDTNSSLKDNLLNDTQHSVENEILQNSVQSILQNDSSPQEVKSPSANDSSSPIASEDNNKAETRSPFSSDNNSSIVENGDIASPETAVAKTLTSMEQGSQEIASDIAKTPTDLVNGLSSGNVTPVDKCDSVELKSKTDIPQTSGDTKSTKNEPTAELLNGHVSDDVFTPPVSEEKVVAAATTIQASFRGFQTRQALKTNESDDVKENKAETVHNKVNELNENSLSHKNDDIEEVKNTADETQKATISKDLKSPSQSPKSELANVDDQMIAAATTIQANFRGFQARQTMKTKLDSELPTSEERNPSAERKTPTALTPELIESVKEEVDEICKEAETIVAERCESAEGMIKGVDQVVMESKTALPSVSESVLAIRGSTSPPSVSDGGAEESLDNEDSKGEVFEPLMDADDKAVQAATAIQATFRGFQTRKNLQKDSTEQFDSMPNYPPPAAEDEYLQSLEDLPPPDFEALESSYSEDVPTEPLAPPPPLQDSLVFNEEDEDELMSLQSTKGEEADDSSPGLRQETDSSDSSLSSAATKIQAGVRGYLTRRQIQATSGGTGTGTGTTSTSTNVLDSDLSQSVSRDDDGVHSALSLDQESEVCRHRASPDREPSSVPKAIKSAGKRMSLGSNIADLPPTRHRPPLRSALSVQAPNAMVSDEEVWGTLKGEMSEAATKIQSNFRGYRARKQLQREDAVQVTSSSSQATPSSGSGRESAASAAPQAQASRGSGEYHDMVVAVSPPTPVDSNEAQAQGGGAQSEVGEPTRPRPDGEPAGAEMVKRHAELQDGESSAATKIQATYRGFKARQGMRDVDRAAAKIQAGFRGYKVRKDMKKGRRSSNPEQGEVMASQPGAGSQEETAATKIQAGVRGFLVRRRNQKEQGQRGSHPQPPSSAVDQ